MLSHALKEATDYAYTQVLNDPNYQLKTKVRRAIMSAFGPDKDTKATRGRIYLAIFTARHVLPIWQRYRKNDRLPILVLQKTEELLEHRVDVNLATEVYGSAWDKLEEVIFESGTNPHFDAIFAGGTAVKALGEALGLGMLSRFGFPIDKNNQEEEQYVAKQDDELDTYPWQDLWDSGHSDAALWAVTAYAGGIYYADGKYQENPNLIKRREFWIWWLREAVPTAWQAVK